MCVSLQNTKKIIEKKALSIQCFIDPGMGYKIHWTFCRFKVISRMTCLLNGVYNKSFNDVIKLPLSVYKCRVQVYR